MDIQGGVRALRRRVRKKISKLIHGRPINRANEYLRAASGTIDLVVHVGAHVGQELETYRQWGIRRVVWIEGDPETYQGLCSRIRADEQAKPRILHYPVCALVSDVDDNPIAFHRFNNKGASSSVYRPTSRLRSEWPGLDTCGDAITLRTRRLESILDELGLEWPSTGKSVLVVDVQGHEAAVLAGLGRYARMFDLCECEVSKEAIYDGGALFPEIKAVLEGLGFRLASHSENDIPWHGNVIFCRDAVTPG
jgi:FkbM family methyltransferase